METVEALTADMDGQWLVNSDGGTQHVIDLDDGTYRPTGERGYTPAAKLTKRMGLPVVGETFGRGGAVTRIARIPEMTSVCERFAEGWSPWISVEFGWYPILADLDAALVQAEPEIRYCQLKEKFGGLRVYVNKRTDEVSALIAEAEERAASTCERCGDTETARMRTRGGWLQTLCDRCAVVKECDAIGIGDAVDELTADMRGVWTVTTQGSQHIWDMDAGTYLRSPGKESLSGSFNYDNVAHKITRVDIYPKVDGFFRVWFDDLVSPLTREQWRQSSTIVRIARVG